MRSLASLQLGGTYAPSVLHRTDSVLPTCGDMALITLLWGASSTNSLNDSSSFHTDKDQNSRLLNLAPKESSRSSPPSGAVAP